jgi:hypothetical protein
MKSLTGSRQPPGNDRCYDSSIGLLPQRPAFGEIATAAVFCILLAAALAFLGYAAFQVIECDSHGLFGDPVWHEPLDSWSL